MSPYVSEAQRKYFHANKGKLEKQGVSVEEWDKATKGKKLPKRAKGRSGNEMLARAMKSKAKYGK